MAGYDGNSMSINAREAYAAGERPWSRWRKQDIIAVIKAAVEAGNLELHCSFRSLCKIALEDLKRVCLYRSSWHHTSFVFNLTEFYSVNLDAVENLTEELIEDFIREGQARRKAERAKKAEDKGELWRCEYLKWYGGRGNWHAKTVEVTGIIRGGWFYGANGKRKLVDGRWFYPIEKIEGQE